MKTRPCKNIYIRFSLLGQPSIKCLVDVDLALRMSSDAKLWSLSSNGLSCIRGRGAPFREGVRRQFLQPELRPLLHSLLPLVTHGFRRPSDSSPPGPTHHVTLGILPGFSHLYNGDNSRGSLKASSSHHKSISYYYHYLKDTFIYA